jgi:hypothetical protein
VPSKRRQCPVLLNGVTSMKICVFIMGVPTEIRKEHLSNKSLNCHRNSSLLLTCWLTNDCIGFPHNLKLNDGRTITLYFYDRYPEYTFTINTSSYWFLLIQITRLHVATRIFVVFRPVRYTNNKMYNCNIILWLD